MNILPGVNNLQSFFFIAAVNKVEPGTSVKTSSVKHGVANESVALTEHVSLLTTQVSYIKFGSTRTYIIKVSSISWSIT